MAAVQFIQFIQLVYSYVLLFIWPSMCADISLNLFIFFTSSTYSGLKCHALYWEQ